MVFLVFEGCQDRSIGAPTKSPHVEVKQLSAAELVALSTALVVRCLGGFEVTGCQGVVSGRSQALKWCVVCLVDISKIRVTTYGN